MTDLLPLSIGIGLAVSVLLTYLFGLATGGLVVPGYIALYLTRPVDVALTLAAGLVTVGIIRLLGKFLIIYGRRRTVLIVLIGYLTGAVIGGAAGLPFAAGAGSYRVIGYIIPGLIGVWVDRQGVVETLTAILVTAVVVRLILALFVGGPLLP